MPVSAHMLIARCTQTGCRRKPVCRLEFLPRVRLPYCRRDRDEILAAATKYAVPVTVHDGPEDPRAFDGPCMACGVDTLLHFDHNNRMRGCDFAKHQESKQRTI